MNKYAIYGVGVVLVCLAVISLPIILESLLTFLLVGAIPGTNYSLSPSIMFVSTVVMLGLIAATGIIERFSFDDSSASLTRRAPARTPKTPRAISRRLPKSRYRHI